MSDFFDVLVIDDVDNKYKPVLKPKKELSDSEKKQSPEIVKFLADFFESTHYINLIKYFSDAVDEMISNSKKYNLIVFDLDLQKSFKNFENEKDKICNTLKNFNINCNSEKNGENGFRLDYGFNGVFLYLLLLSVGYPSERMVIFTGNGDDKKSVQKNIEAEFNFLSIKESMICIKDKENKLDIDSLYFSEKDSYYRVRRLVLHACSYWCEWLEEIKATYGSDNCNDKIPFNSVYRLKNDSVATVAEFLDLLDHVEMLFPVLRPDKPEKVYYQAAKSICGFHENKANLDKTKDDKQKITSITKFHSVSRTFRNWSAHNKFENNTMTAEEFALIFCITLRSYFDEGQKEKDDDKKDFKPDRLDYEKDYWLDTPITDSPKEFNSAFYEIATESLDKINDSITLPTLLNLRRDCDFWTLFFQQGMDKSWRISSINYVLFPLLFNDLKIRFPYIDKLKWNEIDYVPDNYPRKITLNKGDINYTAKTFYSILSGNDNSVQTLFFRQAFNIIRKHYHGK